MTKTPKTREKLLAELEQLDASSEIGKLHRQIEELTKANAELIAARDTATKRANILDKVLKEIHSAMAPIRPSLDAGATQVHRGRVHGAAANAELLEAAARASRAGMAAVAVGVERGTHDPVTGVAYDKAVNPAPINPAKPLGKKDMAKIFPALSGPAEAGREG